MAIPSQSVEIYHSRGTWRTFAIYFRTHFFGDQIWNLNHKFSGFDLVSKKIITINFQVFSGLWLNHNHQFSWEFQFFSGHLGIPWFPQGSGRQVLGHSLAAQCFWPGAWRWCERITLGPLGGSVSGTLMALSKNYMLYDNICKYL